MGLISRTFYRMRHPGELRQLYNDARDQQRVLTHLLNEQQMRMAIVLAENQRLRETPLYQQYDRLRWLFILTYGRSGSTLLQGILTRVPGVLIRGENGGVLEHLYRFHNIAAHNRDRLSAAVPRAPTNSWWGIDGYPAELALRSFRQLFCDTVIRPLPDTTMAGYKEIRWPEDDLRDYVDFVRQVFPGARFVFNTRDLGEVAQSGWWASQPDAIKHLTAEENRLREVAEALGDDCFHVHYNDYVGKPRQLEPLFEWAGLPFNEYHVRDVMARPHSYNNKNV